MALSNLLKTLTIIGTTLILAACGGSSSETPTSGDGDGSGDGGGNNQTPTTYTISTDVSGAGSLSPETHEMTSDETLNMLVLPEEGHELENITGCGGVLSEDQSTYSITNLSADCTVQASFVETPPLPVDFTGNNQTIGRANMSLKAYIVNFDIQPVELDFQTHNEVGESGLFDANWEVLNDDQWVLIEATAGVQLDPEYTGDIATENQTPEAVIYGIAQVKDWKAGANISAFSDITWRLSKAWVGTLPVSELSKRLDEVAQALSVTNNWSLADVLKWSLEDRSDIELAHTARILPSQLATSGDLQPGAGFAGGYQYYLDTGASETELKDYAKEVVGPAISADYTGIGYEYTEVALNIFGAGKVESTLSAFNVDYTQPETKTYVARDVQRHTITAIESITDEVIFTGWHGCPVIVDRLTCEFSGLEAANISASFEYAYTTYADGYVELSRNLEVTPISESEYLFKGTSLSQTDLDKLVSLQNGGYIGLAHPNAQLFHKVLSSVRDTNDDFTVTVQSVDLNEIFIAGTLKPVEVDSYYSVEDESGQIHILREDDTFTDNTFGVEIRKHSVVLSVEDDFVSVEMEIIPTLSMDRSRIDFARNNQWVSVDVFVDQGSDIVGHIQTKLETPELKLTTKQKLRKTRLFMVGSILVTTQIEFTPVLTLGGSVAIKNNFEYRATKVVGFRVSNTDFTTYNTLVSRAGKNFVQLSTDIEAPKFAAKAEFKSTLAAGVALVKFIEGSVGGGVEAKLALRNPISDLNPSSYCNPLKFDTSGFVEGSVGLVVDLFFKEVFERCSLCYSLLKEIEIRPAELGGKKSFPLNTEVNELINKKLNRCTEEGMSVDVNTPKVINYTVGRVPAVGYFPSAQHELLLQEPTGEWVSDMYYQGGSAEQGFDSENPIIIHNHDADRTLYATVDLTVGHEADGNISVSDPFIRFIDYTQIPGLGYEVKYDSPVSLSVQSGPSVNASFGNHEELIGKNFDYRFKIQNSSNLDELENVDIRYVYQPSQQLEIVNTYMYRLENDSSPLILELQPKSSNQYGDLNLGYFLHHIKVTATQASETTEIPNSLISLSTKDGKLVVQFVYNGIGDPSIPVFIDVEHGWNYNRDSPFKTTTIVLPACEVLKNEEGEVLEYNCDEVYRGKYPGF